jgi:hypothetical protein
MENFTFENKSVPIITSSSAAFTLNEYFYIFGFPCIAPFSLALNLLNLVIFSDAEFKNEKLFVYLKLQSLCIAVDMSIVSLSPMYSNKNWPISKSLVARAIHQYGLFYLEDVLEKTELAYTILAAYSCLKMITELTPRQSIGNPYLIAGALLLLMGATTSHKLFQFEIKMFGDLANSTVYYYYYYKSVKTPFYLNVRILKQSLSNINAKIRMTRGARSDQVRESKAVITKMIVIDCSNTIVGHAFIVFYYVLKSSLNGGFPYDGLIWFIVSISYFLKFFIFFYFNKRFRANVNRKLARLKWFVTRKSQQISNLNIEMSEKTTTKFNRN